MNEFKWTEVSPWKGEDNNSWQLIAEDNDFKIHGTLTRRHIFYPNTWIFSWPGITKEPIEINLPVEAVAEAQRRATNLMITKFSFYTELLRKVSYEVPGR